MPYHGQHPYSYDLCKLVNPAREIRILVIKRIENGVLEAELETLDISRLEKGKSDSERYIALSWCWRAYGGDDETPQPPLERIHILKDESTYSIDLSKNVNAALKALYKLPKPILRIWVDWICIDQNNITERSNQVRLMAQVYGKAESVYVWLGEQGHGSELAFAFIPKMLEVQGFNELVTNKDNDKSLDAVKKLLTRDWFSRRYGYFSPTVNVTAVLCSSHL
jgi:hypothetical protein